jgi:hypothetical protein
MQRPPESEQRLEQPGTGQQQRIERARPMLDMAFRGIDARFARVEPGAAVVQVQHPREAHVGIGIDQGAVEHRKHAGHRKHCLAEHEATERDQDQPAKGRLVGRSASGFGRREVHLSLPSATGPGSMAGARKVCAKLWARRWLLCARGDLLQCKMNRGWRAGDRLYSDGRTVHRRSSMGQRLNGAAPDRTGSVRNTIVRGEG